MSEDEGFFVVTVRMLFAPLNIEIWHIVVVKKKNKTVRTVTHHLG